MDNDVSKFIKNSLEEFDNINNKYKNEIKKIKPDFNLEKNIITFDKDSYNYEILGIYHNVNKVWIWGWLLPDRNPKDLELVRKLLNYGLTINIDDTNPLFGLYLYIKTNLINSRFLIKNKTQLDIILAITKKLLKKNCIFLYPHKIQLKETEYLTIYYIVKSKLSKS